MPKNFSKKSILEFLEFKLQGLIKVYGFDLNTGYAQVEGKGEELNRVYGEFDAVVVLIQYVEEGRIEKDIIKISNAFTRKTFEKYAELMIRYYRDKNRFDPGTGYIQVEGKGEELNREYGEYYFYKTLISSLDYFLFHSN